MRDNGPDQRRSDDSVPCAHYRGGRSGEGVGWHGLERGKNGLRPIMMCEVPSNALLAEDFSSTSTASIGPTI